MKVAITGGYGFLGWHTACRLHALHEVQPIRLGRNDCADAVSLAKTVSSVDAVIHIAGVNRATSDADVEFGNLAAASALANALMTVDRPVDVVFANSVQAQRDTAYGRSKTAAAALLREAVQHSGGRFANLLLPNLFGEHGRPGYNSFVATFAHEIAAGRTPTVTDDRGVVLLHAQGAAAALIRAIGTETVAVVPGEEITIREVARTIEEIHELYASRGEIPDLSSPMRRDLFNTYRAAAFPEMWPMNPRIHADKRGELFESFRTHGGSSTSFISSTLPGERRGDHFHLHKVERFLVVRGEAQIEVRRLLHDAVVSFQLSGRRPSFVDMPTLWVHNIRNVGKTELVTAFWSDGLFDPHAPDQYPEAVNRKDIL